MLSAENRLANKTLRFLIKLTSLNSTVVVSGTIVVKEKRDLASIAAIAAVELGQLLRGS